MKVSEADLQELFAHLTYLSRVDPSRRRPAAAGRRAWSDSSDSHRARQWHPGHHLGLAHRTVPTPPVRRAPCPIGHTEPGVTDRSLNPRSPTRTPRGAGGPGAYGVTVTESARRPGPAGVRSHRDFRAGPGGEPPISAPGRADSVRLTGSRPGRVPVPARGRGCSGGPGMIGSC
eukprot:762796-Hanusia_phi.AAC.2